MFKKLILSVIAVKGKPEELNFSARFAEKMEFIPTDVRGKHLLRALLFIAEMQRRVVAEK